jgi:hypothetical protein
MIRKVAYALLGERTMSEKMCFALKNGVFVAVFAGLSGWLIAGNVSPLFEGLAFLGTVVVSLMTGD